MAAEDEKTKPAQGPTDQLPEPEDAAGAKVTKAGDIPIDPQDSGAPAEDVTDDPLDQTGTGLSGTFNAQDAALAPPRPSTGPYF